MSQQLFTDLVTNKKITLPAKAEEMVSKALKAIDAAATQRTKAEHHFECLKQCKVDGGKAAQRAILLLELLYEEYGDSTEVKAQLAAEEAARKQAEAAANAAVAEALAAAEPKEGG